MATKVFCDACGRDTDQLAVKFSYRAHLDDPQRATYEDRDGNPMVGREESFDLCNRCYNAVMTPAVKTFKELCRAANSADQR